MIIIKLRIGFLVSSFSYGEVAFRTNAEFTQTLPLCLDYISLTFLSQLTVYAFSCVILCVYACARVEFRVRVCFLFFPFFQLLFIIINYY